MRVLNTLLLLLATPSLFATSGPCADYQACFASNVLPNNVFFGDNCSSFPPSTQYLWSFGDGTLATTPTAEHQYAQAGTYEVCLTAYWGNCSDTTCTTITVGGNPEPCDPNFAVEMGWNDAGNGLVYFNAASNHTNTNFIWYFGDGSEGYGPTTMHTYAPGSYYVCVSGWYYNPATEDSCWTEDCTTILVQGTDPCADYQACFVSHALPNNGLYFDNCSSFPNNAQFFWSFGDGTLATTPSAEHQYAQAGTYEVCLTAFWGNCSDTTCTIVIVGGSEPCDPNFAVAMGWNDAGNGLVYFNGTTNHPNTNLLWYFGDGTEGYGPTAVHTYAPGSYYVCLSGWYYNPTTQDSCWTEDCMTIMVQGTDPCTGYEACFVSNALANNVFFGDNCSSFPTNAQYLWSFGDGATATTEHGEHQYAQAGTYEVCLTAWWGNCSDTTCTIVIVGGSGPCDPNFAVAMTWNVGPEDVVSFTATSNHINTNFIWYYGDGTEGYGPSTTHTYAEGGSYAVCVSGWYYNATTQDSCWVEDCETIFVQSGPCDSVQACFTANALPQPGAYYFANCSTAPGTMEYLWHFGDGSTSTFANVDHQFLAPGTYTVCLTVFYQTCAEDYCTTVVVPDTECGGLMANYGSIVTGNNVLFQNATTGQGPNTQWYWDFGDGSTSNVSDPTHTYGAPGDYLVCLTVVSVLEGNGGQPVTCQDSYCGTIHAFGPNTCQLQAGFTANVGDVTVQFSNTTTGTGFSTTWHWDFGDGTTSSDAQPSHIFPGLGTYEVCLTAVSIYELAGGGVQTCVDTLCMPVVTGVADVCDQLDADFIATANGLSVQFVSTSAGPSPQSQFYWSFGDGSTGTGPNPAHTYASQGIYEVCLHVVSVYEVPGQGLVTCEDDQCYTVDAGFGNPCDGLVACFEALPFENGAYSFVNCSQLLPINIPAYYFWDFGDGTTSDLAQPMHAFTAGSWTVCLTVMHGDCVDSTCTTIMVTQSGPCSPNFLADFSWTASGTAVVLNGSATMPANGFIWNFGDGSDPGYQQVMTHLYEPPGPFEVCLTAWYWNEQAEDTCFASYCDVVNPFANGVEEALWSAMSVFPVPAHEHVTITGLPHGTVLRLFAADGRAVRSVNSTGTTQVLDVHALAPGTYVLRLEHTQGTTHRKVVVE